jgi:hypothetical protein
MATAPTPAPAPAPTIHEATRVPGGVRRGRQLTRAQAEDERRAGRDIVVCGADTVANCREAKLIEQAVGRCYHDGPHPAGGMSALPHWQQHAPPPEGHSFYETHATKALP